MTDEERNFRKNKIGGLLFSVLLLAGLPGCGTTVSRVATEQLLASDAVDRSVSSIDFRDLTGQKVFFETAYIKNVKSVGVVNSDYIISSLRQQLVAADCRLQDSKETADFVVEARVGALGADRHEIVWGIPANNLLGTVATAVPTAPAIPPIPEIAFAKKTDELAVAKIGLFAYYRETGQPVWQSGLAQSKSTARNSTVLGVGPFQSGTIHEGTVFAGSKIGLPLFGAAEEVRHSPVIPYNSEVHFVKFSREIAIAKASKQQSDEPQVKQVAAESSSQASSPAASPAEPEPQAPSPEKTAAVDGSVAIPPQKAALKSSFAVPTVPEDSVAVVQDSPSASAVWDESEKPPLLPRLDAPQLEELPLPVAEHHSMQFDSIVILERESPAPVSPAPENPNQAGNDAEAPPPLFPRRDDFSLHWLSADYDKWIEALQVPSDRNE